MKKAAIVLAELPLNASVKPKLAAKVTNALAIKFYRACAEQTLRELSKYGRCGEEIARYLFYANGSRQQAEDWMKSIHQETFNLEPQASDADIGARICDAFREVFAAGATMVVLIRPDVPDIDAAVISNACVALESNDIVLGQTHEGGFFLLGLKSNNQCIFEGLPLEMDSVLQEVLARANTSGLSVAPLQWAPVLHAIDTVDDLLKWSELPSSSKNTLFPLAVKLLKENQNLKQALAETGYTLMTP